MNASARMRHNDKGRYAVVINRLCRSALVGLGVLLAFLSAPAHAQSNPKTITMVVPYAAGGGTDTVARPRALGMQTRSASVRHMVSQDLREAVADGLAE